VVACSPAAGDEFATEAIQAERTAEVEKAEIKDSDTEDAGDDQPDSASAGRDESDENTGDAEDTDAMEEQSGDFADSEATDDRTNGDDQGKGEEPVDAPANSDGDATVPAEVANEDGFYTGDDRNERQRIISEGWATDWNRHTVPYSELLALLPVRDGIPAIDEPTFIAPGEASAWLADNEPVITFEHSGDARAYPLQIMTYHEIVNDEVGDLPVTVTFCPLCNSAIVFDRNLYGTVYDFGTSGWLRNSDLVMYDRQTESLWQQFTGEGIVGTLAGAQLTFLPSSIVSFADFKAGYPEGMVLSRETGHQRPYGQNPYPGYDAIGQNPFAFVGVPDGRLAAMERVITVSLDEVDVAYPLSLLFEAGVINDTQGGQELVIFHMGGTSSALDAPVIQLGADVGATGAFNPNLNGQKLTFVKQDGIIVDEQTGSSWNILGQATDGPLTGEMLAPIIHGDYFWFAWAAFRPETVIFGS